MSRLFFGSEPAQPGVTPASSRPRAGKPPLDPCLQSSPSRKTTPRPLLPVVSEPENHPSTPAQLGPEPVQPGVTPAPSRLRGDDRSVNAERLRVFGDRMEEGALSIRGLTFFLMPECVAASCTAPQPPPDAGVEASDASVDASRDCPPGQIQCSNGCTDLTFDFGNCRRCGFTCSKYVSSSQSGQCYSRYPCSTPCSAEFDDCRQWRWMCHGEWAATCEPTNLVMPAGTACDGGVRCDAGVCVE